MARQSVHDEFSVATLEIIALAKHIIIQHMTLKIETEEGKTKLDKYLSGVKEFSKNTKKLKDKFKDDTVETILLSVSNMMLEEMGEGMTMSTALKVLSCISDSGKYNMSNTPIIIVLYFVLTWLKSQIDISSSFKNEILSYLLHSQSHITIIGGSLFGDIPKIIQILQLSSEFETNL